MPNALSSLIEFLEENENWQTPKEYLIYEHFSGVPDPIERAYKAYNLLIYEEDGICWADDAEGFIQGNNVNLRLFSLSDIIYLKFHEEEPYITITVAGDTYDGYIRIYY